MTVLIVDPLKLHLFKDQGPLRARLIVQVCAYDHSCGVLTICQAANFRLNRDFANTDTYEVNVSAIADQLDPDSISEGYIVDLGVFYDGKNITGFECQSVNPECLIMGNAALTLRQLSLLDDL